MTAYPEQIDDLATDVEDRDRGKTGEPDKSKPVGAGFHAGLHNHVNEAVMAVEQTLGLEPQGDDADVAARLAAIDSALAGTDADLVSAVATLTASVNAKQDAATAATDNELAAAVSTINSALALKQDAASAATDSEMASEKTARERGDATVTAAASAAQATADAALPKAGGTMTGALILAGDPTASLHPATKQYLEAKIAALINGAPGTLDTLKEIADQLGSDESAVTALTATVAAKLGAAANLSDLVDVVAARANLGLGSAATEDVGAAGEAGTVLASDDPAIVLNAKNYGAVGNGVADDTMALQTAVDAAAGGRLRIPTGRYRITAQLLLPSNVILEGDGDQASVIVGTWTDASGAASKGGSYVRNADTSGTAEEITVRDLGFEGTGTGEPAGSPANGVATGLLLRRVKGVRIYNCRAYRIPGIAIAYQGCQRVRIIGNEVYQGGRDGITGMWYTDNLSDIVVANNVIREVGDDGIALGATAEKPNTVERPKDLTITGNTIYGAKQKYASQAGRGIVVTGVEDVTISDNAISDTFSSGIAVNLDNEGSLFRCRRVSVTGNSVDRAAVWNDGTQPTVGIRMVGVDSCVVQGNTVSGAAGDGIYVANATSTPVNGNAVEGCGTALGSFAVNIDGESGVRNVFDCPVVGNTARNNTGGIRCFFTNKCPVMGNTCVNNGRTGNGTQNNGAGIIFGGDTVFAAIGNTCYDTNGAGSKTQTFGIVVTGTGPSLHFVGNYLVGNAGSSISLTGVSPTWMVKRGNIESATAGSALNFDQDLSGTKHYSGTGSPETVVEAPIGSIFRRTDGGASTVLYIKESGTGKTGWVAK